MDAYIYALFIFAAALLACIILLFNTHAYPLKPLILIHSNHPFLFAQTPISLVSFVSFVISSPARYL